MSTGNNPMKKTRSAYWDNWKGIAIIAVVIAHASSEALHFPEGSFNFYFAVGLRQVVNSVVMIFFALAGYFAVAALNESTLQYYGKRVWRIVIPYCFWTTVYLALRTPKTLPDFDEIASGYLLGTGIGIGYFVIVLLQFVLMTPLLLKIKTLKVHLILIVGLSLLGQALIYYFRTQQPESVWAQFPVSNVVFIVWYPFYHLGLVLAMYKQTLNLERIKPSILPAAILVSLLCSFGESALWLKSGFNQYAASQLQASNFLYSLLVVLFVVFWSGKKNIIDSTTALTWLGRNSYTIYLIHLIFLGVAKKLPVPASLYAFQPFYILLTTAISIIGCTLFIIIFNKLFGKKISAMVLG